MNRKILLNEDLMLAAEARVPLLAAQAGSAAYQRALTLSGKVVKAVGGRIVELHANGTEREIGIVGPGRTVTKGVALVRRAAR